MEYNLKLIHSKKSVSDFGELPISGVFVLADVKTTSWLGLFCRGVRTVSVLTLINSISFSWAHRKIEFTIIPCIWFGANYLGFVQ